MQRRSKLQFGIGSVLFVMLLVAGYFHGLNRGDSDRQSATLLTKSYDLRTMLHSHQPVDQQLETISTLIRKAIAPDSWSEHGGLATLKIYSSNRAMVVTQYPSELEKIDKLLGSLEKLANNRTSKIEYDVSAIIDLGSSKPVDDQLKAICTMLDRRFPTQAFIPLELVKDPDGALIVASTNEQGHAAIKAFLDQLRHSREAVAEIDR